MGRPVFYAPGVAFGYAVASPFFGLREHNRAGRVEQKTDDGRQKTEHRMQN
jgi:hypothetical protein